MVKKTMTIEKGIAIEAVTEALYAIKARLMRLEKTANSIDPEILGEINKFHIEIVRTVRSLSEKTVNEIYETKSEFDKKYGYFQKLLSV